MQSDEQAIRQLVEDWLEASKKNDLDTILSLMTDDVVFMVPGKEPFGKEAFAATSEKMKASLVEGISDIKEIEVVGDWAWMRNFLTVKISTPDGNTSSRSGYVLTILRKGAEGNWAIARDANLLA
ncbi:MAG TPA: SgcJ/EcaC family oxidoreductase [Pyrinomonadaceae bacterium]|nr:SgcJ/EcaC family oxidoreductase [Pyrinomonadaceae bacterium]